MANSTIPVSAADLVIIASGGDVRDLTVYGDDATRQTRNGADLVQLRATVLMHGKSLGEVALQTSKSNFADVQAGDVLQGSGEAELKFAGTSDDWGLRVTTYVQGLHQIPGLNAWGALTDLIKRAQQAAK
ncbi:hypothetical protein [Herbiconiux sp. UC225_62]|uniref:hypothetical protein n=1 Tax=Herbiconiux sp. UC225_62 TaxID=3350168 RepID=UPI0036D2CDB7